MKEDIVTLYLKVEAMKASDPRSKGTVDDIISMYVDIGEVIKAAGWGYWEYEAALCSLYN